MNKTRENFSHSPNSRLKFNSPQSTQNHLKKNYLEKQTSAYKCTSKFNKKHSLKVNLQKGIPKQIDEKLNLSKKENEEDY